MATINLTGSVPASSRQMPGGDPCGVYVWDVKAQASGVTSGDVVYTPALSVPLGSTRLTFMKTVSAAAADTLLLQGSVDGTNWFALAADNVANGIASVNTSATDVALKAVCTFPLMRGVLTVAATTPTALKIAIGYSED